MKKFLTIFFTLAVAIIGEAFAAQFTQQAMSIIDKACVTSKGQKAKIVITRGVQCEACAYIDRTGQPLVTIDIDFWAKLSDASKVFVLGHECGHQKLGHTLAGGGSEPKGEFEADCWSVQFLYKNKLLTTKAQLLDVEKDFYNFYGNLPFHRSDSHPGTIERFDAIISCFQKVSGQASQVQRRAFGHL